MFIVDKNYRFSYECSLFFILGLSLLLGLLMLSSYIKEPEYSSREPVLEVGLFCLLLFTSTAFGWFSLERFTYIDIAKKQLRMYVKVFSFDFSYSIININDILELGVSSVAYTFSHVFGHATTKNYYFLVLLRKDGKIFRVTGERKDLQNINLWAEKLAKKLRKPFFPGQSETPLHVLYNKQDANYKLDTLTGVKSFFARANCFEKSFVFLVILINVVIFFTV